MATISNYQYAEDYHFLKEKEIEKTKIEDAEHYESREEDFKKKVRDSGGDSGKGSKISIITKIGLATVGIGMIAKNPPIIFAGITATILGELFKSKINN